MENRAESPTTGGPQARDPGRAPRAAGPRAEKSSRSKGFSMYPVSPWSTTTSRLPPKLVATTGLPCSMASRFTSPNVSKQIEGVTKTSVAA
jgi:hypothetical protein